MPHAESSLRRFAPAVACGLALAVAEVLLAGLLQPQLFLSLREFGRFAGIAGCVAISICLAIRCAFAVIAQLLWRIAPARFALALALVTGAVSSPLAVGLFWLLTEGRRVHDSPLRPWLVCAAALVAAGTAVTFALGILALSHARPRRRRPTFFLLLAAAAGWLTADVLVLPRLYPVFHIALDALAVLCSAGAAQLWPWRMSRRMATWLGTIGVGCGLLAPFFVRALLRAPNLRYAVEQSAPITGKLLHEVRLRSGPLTTQRRLPPSAARPSSVAAAAPGINLRGNDVLLITIDALRADRLQACGGAGDVAPELDQLAEQSVVFTRAYTQTPRASYALGSLFTGKYLRPVLSMPGAATDHATLPRVLRRYGYRTAAFYPPAVFFVDGERMRGLSQDHFGFEYVKEMFAPAATRVEQLREYLATVTPGHPVLVWVHLFEPHEPYEPPADFARGAEPEQRYDGEVAAADAAVAQLVRVFRQRRPDSTVIVTADHGEEFGDHGGYHHGTTLFEEQVRVPLLWSSPGRSQARPIDAPVQLIDIAPTLLAALGVPRDVRMRGNDLSSLLIGAAPSPELRAFASIEELRMWSDGPHKLICEASEAACRLYDLTSDPGETRDATEAEPQLAQRMLSELSELVASIPAREAMAMNSGDAWPKALARARLGDASVGDALLPLLGDPRVAVRSEAVRAVAALRLVAALPVLGTLARQDAAAEVRDEAAVAGLALGDEALLEPAQRVLTGARQTQPELARRAAFALMPHAQPAAAECLAELAADSGAVLSERERALAALARSHAQALAPKLIPLLADVRLRPAVATCLGQLGGGQPVITALSNALRTERYAEARSAEAAALVQLRASTSKALLLQALGTETGLPGGLELWAELSHTRRGPHGYLLDLREASEHAALKGRWTCQPRAVAPPGGCSASAGALLVLRRGLVPKHETRWVIVAWSREQNGWLSVGDEEYSLRRGRNELAFFAPAARSGVRSEVGMSDGVRLQLLGLLPRQADVPPPAPEPYEEASASDSAAPDRAPLR